MVEYGGQTLLFDSGGDSRILLSNMRLMGIDPQSIDSVVLSHIHSDHTGGLEGLLQSGVQPRVFVLPSFSRQVKQTIAALTDVIEVSPRQEVGFSMFSTGEIAIGSVPEQALVIETYGGLVVVTGCAHPGITQIVAKAKDLFDRPVNLIIGGFHLQLAGEGEIRSLLADLRRLGVRRVAPTHCTGEKAVALFAAEYGDDFIESGVGKVITFEVDG